MAVSGGARIDVLIADRDNMAGQLMASALKRCRNQFDVVGVASDSGQAIEKLSTLKPHVALVSPELEDGAQSGRLPQRHPRDSRTRSIDAML